MPFIDTTKLDTIERRPGWRGRFFDSANMSFAYYTFEKGSTRMILAFTLSLVTSPAFASYICNGSDPELKDGWCRYISICQSSYNTPDTFGVRIDCRSKGGMCPKANECYKELQYPEGVKDLCTRFGNDCWEEDPRKNYSPIPKP